MILIEPRDSKELSLKVEAFLTIEYLDLLLSKAMSGDQKIRIHPQHMLLQTGPESLVPKPKGNIGGTQNPTRMRQRGRPPRM